MIAADKVYLEFVFEHYLSYEINYFVIRKYGLYLSL